MRVNFPIVLKELRERAGFESQTKFAEACGVDNSTIARLERGESRPSPQTLDKLAPILRITLTELMIAAGYIDQPTPSQAQERELHLNKAGEDALGLEQIASQYMDRTKLLKKNESVPIPIFGTIKTDNNNNLTNQEIIGNEVTSMNRVGNGEYFYLKVTGDSMVDAGIKEGYKVLVKRQNFVGQGKIAVVVINGDTGTLKRVYYEDSMVILQSENSTKKYPPLILNKDNVLIQGQVVKVEFDV